MGNPTKRGVRRIDLYYNIHTIEGSELEARIPADGPNPTHKHQRRIKYGILNTPPHTKTAIYKASFFHHVNVSVLFKVFTEDQCCCFYLNYRKISIKSYVVDVY